MTSNDYVISILRKYNVADLTQHATSISYLKSILEEWASGCFIEILDSGSRAKGTAISIASDVDYMVSLSSSCNENKGGLQSLYDGLYSKLKTVYGVGNVRKQNVSFRIILDGTLEVDITPGRKHSGNTNDHWIYVSKIDSWRQTNIQKHIRDIGDSGRKFEIKLLKIWRELHSLDFSSIYIEYLMKDIILIGKSKNIDDLSSNFWYALTELSKDTSNPLFSRVVDPANSTNILSDLLTITEKNKIIQQAKSSINQKLWKNVIW